MHSQARLGVVFRNDRVRWGHSSRSAGNEGRPSAQPDCRRRYVSFSSTAGSEAFAKVAGAAYLASAPPSGLVCLSSNHLDTHLIAACQCS